MSAYYFHATNGAAVEVDEIGEEVRLRRSLTRVAGEKACALMAERGPSLDWSAWAMHVYDGGGEVVAVVPFAEAEPGPRTPRDLAQQSVARRTGRMRLRGARTPRTPPPA